MDMSTTAAIDESGHDGEEGGRLPRHLLAVILVASFGSLLLNLNTTTVNVGIDRLMTDLDMPLATAQWIVVGFLLAMTLVLPLFRFAVERAGMKNLYVGCLVAFALTSGLCSLAWSSTSLVAFRLIQGGVGGLLAPLAQALAAQFAGPKRMGRAVSLISIPVLAAPIFGPALGGLLIEAFSWRSIFWINIPFALVGAVAAYRILPRTTANKRAPRLDFPGLALLSPGIALFTFALSSLGHGRAAGLTVALTAGLSIALLAAFFVDAARRPRTALLDVHLFRRPAVSASLAAYLCASFGNFGVSFVLPLYFEQVRHASPLDAGLWLAPQGVGMLLTLPQVGRLTDRFDNGKILAVGVLLACAGTLAFTFVDVMQPATSVPLSIAALVVRGAGLGATGTPALAAAYKHLTRDEIPNGTTLMNVVQRLGAPLGTASMAVSLQLYAASGDDKPTSFANTLFVACALSALAFVPAYVLVKTNQGARR
jgi:EmrB/QacA subfamily drug resistance transporter